MWIRNTSQYPLDEVKRLVRFAASQFDRTTTARLCVNVRNCKQTYHGNAYFSVPHVSNAPRTARSLVVLRIGAPEKFPSSNIQQTIRWVTLKPGEVCDPSEIRYTTYYMPKRVIAKRRVLTDLPYGGAGSPVIETQDWQEALLVLAAHEFMHIDQYQRSRPASEVEAERMAAVVLERYRKTQEEK